jgi:hypothetical protein
VTTKFSVREIRFDRVNYKATATVCYVGVGSQTERFWVRVMVSGSTNKT